MRARDKHASPTAEKEHSRIRRNVFMLSHVREFTQTIYESGLEKCTKGPQYPATQRPVCAVLFNSRDLLGMKTSVERRCSLLATGSTLVQWRPKKSGAGERVLRNPTQPSERALPLWG